MKGKRSCKLVMLLVIVMGIPCFGQTVDLKEVLAGKIFPLSVKLKDLNAEWRRVKAGGMYDTSSLMMMYGLMQGSTLSHYTKGDTVTIGSETYLVTYRPPTKDARLAAMMRGEIPREQRLPEKLTPETGLSLSLLNLKTTGSLNDVAPFNMQEEIAAQNGLLGIIAEQTAKPVNASSDSNLKQLGLALIMYANDYDDVLPPMKEAATVKKALLPYIRTESIFVHPGTHEPYQPNPILSRKKLAHIKFPASMVALYEASPAADGTRGLLFLDGHVARIPETEWPQHKQASKIP
ncbi:MAG: hypothetical protein HY318_14430 [Armatimonadetes bacterium]|nr:hypothetical protein [Armatimonadota bacterium]